MRFPFLLLLITAIAHYAMPSIDDAFLITMVPFKTGENMGWFATWHQGTKDPEWIQVKTPFPVSRKRVIVNKVKEERLKLAMGKKIQLEEIKLNK